DSVTVTGCATPAVSIAKTNSVGGSVAAGGTFNWIITATVSGNTTTAVTTISDTFPAGLTVGAVTPGAGVTCTGGNAFPCTLPAGTAVGTYTMTVAMTAPGATPGSNCKSYQNSGTATGSNVANGSQSSQDSVAVTGCAGSAVSIVKTNSVGGSVAAGGTFNSIITATVSGNTTTAITTISDTFPAGMTHGAVTPGAGVTCTGGNAFPCTLPVGTAVGTYTMTVAMTAPGGTPSSNCTSYQ